jgi:hypothetical protein
MKERVKFCWKIKPQREELKAFATEVKRKKSLDAPVGEKPTSSIQVRDSGILTTNEGKNRKKFF